MFDWRYVLMAAAVYAVSGLMNLALSRRTQVDAWCEARPGLAGALKVLRGFGLDPWAIAQGLVLIFQKKLPEYQKQSLEELGDVKAVVAAAESRRAPKAPFMPLITMLIGIGLALMMLNGACTKQQVAQALSTEQDIAKVLCGQYFSSKAGLSIADAQKAFCDAQQLVPFIQQVVYAKQRAGAMAEIRAAHLEASSDAGPMPLELPRDLIPAYEVGEAGACGK